MIEVGSKVDWLMTDAEWRKWYCQFPTLQSVHAARVFSVGILTDGRIGIAESCDDYFRAEMTPADLRAIAAEVIAIADIADRMKGE